jgi:hypothetical protein
MASRGSLRSRSPVAGLTEQIEAEFPAPAETVGLKPPARRCGHGPLVRKSLAQVNMALDGCCDLQASRTGLRDNSGAQIDGSRTHTVKFSNSRAITPRAASRRVVCRCRSLGYRQCSMTAVRALQRDSDRKADARIHAVAEVVAVVINDVNVIVSVPVLCPGSWPGID